MKKIALSLSVVPLFLACELFNQDIEIPLEVETPEEELDVDGPVADAEEAACADLTANSCVTLQAICNTGDDTTQCATQPRMPPQFPEEIDVGGETVTADQAMEDMGLAEAMDQSAPLPVDTGSALEDQGVKDNKALKTVTIDSVTVVYTENSLSFDTPPSDVYISNEAIDIDAEDFDANALIESGEVEKVGTIPAQPAGSTAELPMDFVSGGKEKFSEALKGGQFTVLTKANEPISLRQVDGTDPQEVYKPGGKAKIKMKAVAVAKVSAADVVGGG